MPARKRKAKRGKASARKMAAKVVKRKIVMVTTPLRSAMNKSQLLSHIGEMSDLSRKQVAQCLEALANAMHRHIRKGGAGEFTVPGLLKCIVKHKPATKARKGINPFTGEMITFKAKPARDVVKIRALKRLKEMVK
jgi:nucleoid DNA-binding protein